MRVTAGLVSLLAAATLASTQQLTPEETFEDWQQENEAVSSLIATSTSTAHRASAHRASAHRASATPARPEISCGPARQGEFYLPAKFFGENFRQGLCKERYGCSSRSERCIGSYNACKGNHTKSGVLDEVKFRECFRGKKPGPLPKDIQRAPYLAPADKNDAKYKSYCGKGKEQSEECVGTLSWCKDRLWEEGPSEWKFRDEHDCFLSRQVEKGQKLPFLFQHYPPQKIFPPHWPTSRCRQDNTSEICLGTMKFCHDDPRPFKSQEDCWYARTRPLVRTYYKEAAQPTDPNYEENCPANRETVFESCLGTKKFCESAEDPRACENERINSDLWQEMWDKNQQHTPDYHIVKHALPPTQYLEA